MLNRIATMNRSERLLCLGISAMVLAGILLLFFLVLFHIRTKKLNAKLDEEYGKGQASVRRSKRAQSR